MQPENVNNIQRVANITGSSAKRPDIWCVIMIFGVNVTGSKGIYLRIDIVNVKNWIICRNLSTAIRGTGY